MNENLVALKATIAAAVTAISAFLGWKGVMMLAWVIAMALDYLTGTAAAMKTGEWCSANARQGAWHKCGMIVVVVVSGIADFIMVVICANIPIGLDWPAVVLPLVLAWYIITELGSILENAVKMGANVPSWLVRMLKASAKVVESAGEASSGEEYV